MQVSTRVEWSCSCDPTHGFMETEPVVKIIEPPGLMYLDPTLAAKMAEM